LKFGLAGIEGKEETTFIAGKVVENFTTMKVSSSK
jgi:hypothetical protein